MEKKKKFVMMSVDMDHMKAINDAYGHLMGDEAIRRMGRIMRVVETIGLTPVHISGDEFLAYGILDDGREAGEVTELVRKEQRALGKGRGTVYHPNRRKCRRTGRTVPAGIWGICLIQR